MHALLFRKWGTNVKGRDWYDMEWYIRKGVLLNLSHFVLRAKDSGDWNKDTITEAEFKELLRQKIETVKFQYIVDDIRRFIRDPKVLEIWNSKFFLDLMNQMKFEF